MSEIEKPKTEPSIDLPDLQNEVIDEHILSQLFEDLAASAEVHEVRTKAAATQRAEKHNIGLSEAHRLLQAGEIFGVQLLYTHDQIRWFDTLLQAPGGWRLIRMKAPPSSIS
jgi:hypothetical protein